jgi:hypothetical protein
MYYEGECAVPDCGRPGRDYHQRACSPSFGFDRASGGRASRRVANGQEIIC